MAQLPPDGEYLVQQNDGIVTIFNQYTQTELVRFDPSDADATARAQFTIYTLDELSDEQKCFAHFWCGYFHANNGGNLAIRLTVPFPMVEGSTPPPKDGE